MYGADFASFAACRKIEAPNTQNRKTQSVMELWRRRIWQVTHYGRNWQHYLLLWRAFLAARLIRHNLGERQLSPSLVTTIAAVEKSYLPPQAGWRGVEAVTIMHFAGFVVGVPLTWGRCVQKSLIAYRLLNGYGIPVRFCCGVNRQNQALAGHAWIERLSEPRQVLGESYDPYLNYVLVYASPIPPIPESLLQ
jgi:hypothetical protein